jgi:hypothetical protein
MNTKHLKQDWYLESVKIIVRYFSGFDDMMGGNPPMHHMNPGPPMGSGYPPHPMMAGGPPPPHHLHGGHPPPPNAASPQGFMDDLGGDVSMDIEGLMLSSPPYSTNYSQSNFEY